MEHPRFLVNVADLVRLEMGLFVLKAEAEKGSMRTAVGHGLVDPKRQGKPSGMEHNRAPALALGLREGLVLLTEGRCVACRKGIRLRFLNRDKDAPRGHGNVNEPKNMSESPRESCLFFLTAPLF